MSILKVPFGVLARIDEEIRFLGIRPDYIHADRWCLALACKHILRLYLPLLFERLTCKIAIDAPSPLFLPHPQGVAPCDSCPPLTRVYQLVHILVLRFHANFVVDRRWVPPFFSHAFLTTLPKMHQLGEIILHSSQCGLWPGLADVIFRVPSLNVLRLIDVRWPALMSAYNVGDISIPARRLNTIICQHTVHYKVEDAESPEFVLWSNDELMTESRFLHKLAVSQCDSLLRLEVPSESFAASLFLETRFPVLTYLRLFGVGLPERLQLPLLMRAMPSLRNLYIEVVQSTTPFHLLTAAEASSPDTATAFYSLRTLSLVNCYPDDPIFLFIPPDLVSLTIVSDPIRTAGWAATASEADEAMLVPTPEFWGPSQIMRIFGHLPLKRLEYLRLGVTSNITQQAARCLVHGRPLLVRLDLHFGPWSQLSLHRVSLPYVVDVLCDALHDSNLHFLCLDADWNEDQFVTGKDYRRYRRRDLYFQKRLFDYWSSVAATLSFHIPSLWRVAFAFMAVNRKVLAWGRWQVFHARPESHQCPILSHLNPETFLL
ncbi:hypothetical protein FISHEDRAFT_78074 [Fistulina hepatica ATCC 64428]|nr:hypothetical protein FISHEDRAFT_78074 [Fistulina hepatica ATCC 64428]